MSKTSWSLLVVGLCCSFVLLSVTALAASPVPPAFPAPALRPAALPAAFWGAVSINGVPADAGILIEAAGAGVTPATAGNPIGVGPVGVYGGQGPFDARLVVEGDVLDGTPIEFYVDGVRAQCAVPGGPWQDTFPYLAGSITRLDLNSPEQATTSTPTQTPVETPTPTQTPAETPTPTLTPTPWVGQLLRAFVPLVLLDYPEQPMPTPTATSTPSGTPTSTATTTPAGPCPELLKNGGFEADEAWIIPVTEYTASYTTTRAYSGHSSMRIGIVSGPDAYSYSSASQFIKIPDGAPGATLSFWWYPVSQEGPLYAGQAGAGADTLSQETLRRVADGTLPAGTLSGDRQYVLLMDEYGNTLATLMWTRSSAQAWRQVILDLPTDLAGRTVRPYFGVYNDGNGLTTGMYVDQVSVVGCRLSTPSPTPTSTPPNTCGDRLVNGGFENSATWVFPATEHTAGYSTALAHSGARSMLAGIAAGPDIFSYSSGYQDVAVPTDATSMSLRFWWHPISREGTLPPGEAAEPPPSVLAGLAQGAFPMGTMAGDRQYVLMLDAQGNILEYLLYARSDAETWQERSYTLPGYVAGHTVRFQFGVYNDGDGRSTAMYVDDAALVICRGHGPTPTPTPTITPGACSERVANSGFESNSAWIVPITAYSAAYSRANPYQGLRSLRAGIVGGGDVYSYSTAYEYITIPAGTANATLRFLWYPKSLEGSLPAQSQAAASDVPSLDILQQVAKGTLPAGVLSSDRQYVFLLDQYGNTLTSLVWTRSDARAWSQQTINLPAYAIGRTVGILFGVYNDGNGQTTGVYVDNASVLACG